MANHLAFPVCFSVCASLPFRVAIIEYMVSLEFYFFSTAPQLA